MARIFPKNIGGSTYYYYQESYRVKIEPGNAGKTKGSGKSQVKTRTVYLGDAETLLDHKNRVKGPATVTCRSFGLVAAALVVAREIGLEAALRKHLPGSRYGLPRWLFFLITIINRLDDATSKNKMSAWAKKTVLPELLAFDPAQLTSKHYWYVTDDVLSEAELRCRREQKPDSDDLFGDLDDRVFRDLEDEVIAGLRPLLEAPAAATIYDTTNFFTFFDCPDASELARPGHNKDGRHNLRQIGLALALDRRSRLPLWHRVYRGNSHDAPTFSAVVDDLIDLLPKAYGQINDLTLVLDKGNNSKDNFDQLAGRIQWIGSLAPTQHQDLLAVVVDRYDGVWEGLPFLRRQQYVLGRDCLLIMTYNEKLARKKEHKLQNDVAKLRSALDEKFSSYKKPPTTMTAGLRTVLAESRGRNLVRATVDEAGLHVELNEETAARKRRSFGKNLLFTSRLDAETGWVIQEYKAKEAVEDGFKTLKDVDLIRIRPVRHWTDTKIRAFIFCCVMSLLLWRIMELRASEAGVAISSTALKNELSDLREVLLIYDDNSAEMKITEANTNQRKLMTLFGLDQLATRLTLHHSEDVN
jgi:transposase